MNLFYFNQINFVPKTILDIGCNVGQFYNLCRNMWGNNVEIILIDGNDNVEEDIKRLNVPYHIVVLSDSIKKVMWYSTIENPKCTGDSYYRENTEHYSQENLIMIEKETNTLDNIFSDSRFDLIKLDTQGSEIDIIKGGINLCKKAKFMILETSLIEYNLNSPNENQVNDFMNSIGFLPISIIGIHYLNGQVSQRDILYENSVS
jgi:FkbM family methyltransferase